MNELHSLTGNAPAQVLGLDVAQAQDVDAGDVGDVDAVGRSQGGIIHGAPAGSKAGCCGNHHCVHERTAYRSGSVVRSGRGRSDWEGERWIGVLVAGRKSGKRQNRGNYEFCTVRLRFTQL